MTTACLVDTTLCIGCRACQVACKEWFEMPAEQTSFLGTGGGYENPPALSGKTLTRITFHEILDADGALERSVFVKRQCMHCVEPACVSACPVAALEKVKVNGKAEGPVIYHPDKCIGCRYCMMACPFDIPKLEWDKLLPHIKKCSFCFNRIGEAAPATAGAEGQPLLAPRPEDARPPAPPGAAQVDGRPLSDESLKRFEDGQRTPACALACPTEAIAFGDRDELMAAARRRIAGRREHRDSWQYVDHIYGEREVGGTSWLYISNVPFERLDFRMDLGERAYPEYTALALDAVPPAVIAIGVALGGVYWVSNRRDAVAKAERPGEE